MGDTAVKLHRHQVHVAIVKVLDGAVGVGKLAHLGRQTQSSRSEESGKGVRRGAQVEHDTLVEYSPHF